LKSHNNNISHFSSDNWLQNKVAKHHNSVTTVRSHTNNLSKICTLLYSRHINVTLPLITNYHFPTVKTLIVPYIRPVKLFPTIMAQETLKCEFNSLLEQDGQREDGYLFPSHQLRLKLKSRCLT